MKITITEQQRAGLNQQLREYEAEWAESAKVIAAVIQKKILDYEAQHGVVNPAPKGKEYRKTPRNPARLHGYLKRLLMDCGEWPPPNDAETTP